MIQVMVTCLQALKSLTSHGHGAQLLLRGYEVEEGSAAPEAEAAFQLLNDEKLPSEGWWELS